MLGLVVAASVLAAWRLELDPLALLSALGDGSVLREFASAALRPAVVDQGGGGHSLLPIGLAALVETVRFAIAGLSLAVVLGLPLGLFCSERMQRGFALAGARGLAACLRSVHELVWAILFLAALGSSPLAAVVAIALPYAGVLAKVFAELLDEAPTESGEALTYIGASSSQAFLLGTLPRTLPDLASYLFYRFECALRSAAVLGFFGFPTLGYHIAASADNLYWNEVWTWLYLLFGTIFVADRCSATLRVRLVAR